MHVLAQAHTYEPHTAGEMQRSAENYRQYAL